MRKTPHVHPAPRLRRAHEQHSRRRPPDRFAEASDLLRPAEQQGSGLGVGVQVTRAPRERPLTMGNLHAIHSVGFSLMKYLRNAYPAELRQEHACDFRLVSSGEMNGKEVDFGTAVTLFLYRVTVNPYVRNSPRLNAAQQCARPLSVDLHYLLSVWADNALAEHTILGWVVRQLYMHQTLSRSDLTPDGGWEGDEMIQLIPSELSNEDLMRIWDALDPGYRLSISYIARVVRIDPDALPDGRVVVSRTLEFQDEERVS